MLIRRNPGWWAFRKLLSELVPCHCRKKSSSWRRLPSLSYTTVGRRRQVKDRTIPQAFSEDGHVEDLRPPHAHSYRFRPYHSRLLARHGPRVPPKILSAPKIASFCTQRKEEVSLFVESLS